MNISNTGFRKSIYNALGVLQLSGSVSLPDGDSSLELGVSGTSSSRIKFANSKIYDNGNRVIAGYAYGETITFVLNADAFNYDVYINDKPKVLGQAKSMTGYDEYITLQCSGGVEIDYYANSDKPNYSVTDLITTSSTSGDLTGYVVNLSSKAFEFYSVSTTADLFTVDSVSGSVAPLGSGEFTLTRSSDYTGGYMTVPLRIYTNFGVLSESVDVSGAYSDSSNFSISLSGPSRIPDGYQNSYAASVFSISGSDPFSIYLNHISGSGAFNQLTGFSGSGSNNYSGLLTGSGYLTCISTQSVTGGSVTGSNIQNLQSTGATFAYATGAFSESYQVTCYGIATGVGYTGFSSGYVTYTASGTCPSGYAEITGNVSGNPSGLVPIELVTLTNATGAIYYNVPENEVTSDILYVGSNYVGIVFGFHYDTISGLSSYLNNNKTIHKVTAVVSGANTVLVSSDAGYEGNFIVLDADNDNDGSMTVSGPTLRGGSDTAYTGSVSPSGNFTGAISTTYLHTGYYTVTQTGYLYASGQSPYLIREFGDIWSLSTGYDIYSSVDFESAGATGANGYLKSGVSDGLLYCYLDYANYSSSATDVVELTVTGGGKSQTIRITGLE